METGLAGVTGIPPPVSPSSGGGKRSAKAAVQRGQRGAPFVGCSVPLRRAPSLGARSILRAVRGDTDQC